MYLIRYVWDVLNGAVKRAVAVEGLLGRLQNLDESRSGGRRGYLGDLNTLVGNKDKCFVYL